jgi:hypothetical protein
MQSHRFLFRSLATNVQYAFRSKLNPLTLVVSGG